MYIENPFRRQQNIQSILTRYFLIVLVIFLVLSSAVFSLIQYYTLRVNTIDSLQDTCRSIQNSLEQQVDQMNTISLNVISSSGLRDSFVEYGDPDLSSYNKNLIRRELANRLAEIKGFDFSIRQLNIFHMEEGGYGLGSYNGDLPFSASGMPWYEATREAEGALYLASPAADPFLSDKAGMAEDTLYFSLCREFYNNMHVPLGYIEVKKFYDTVFSLALLPDSSYSPIVVIYDKDGRQLFPAEASYTDESSYFALRENGNGDYKSPATGGREYVCFSTAPKDRFTVVTALPYSRFLAPIFRSLLAILAVFLFLFVICLLLSWFLARRISLPIRHIYHFLSMEDRDRFQTIEMENTGIREIDKLHHSLDESIHSLKNATDTMMTLKEQEVQAQMLALQSQMNPHFLYNSLSTIAEMAEEGLTTPVAHMCRQITQIFRYISSNREQLLSLEEELELCDMYLDCMKMRFGDDLSYRFEVPDDMLELPIPKLCVQLLVENAIKFTASQAPPWRILIRGEIRENNAWAVTVSDNGPGFSPEVESDLRRKMEDILETGTLPSLRIEGMGILNIFIRLYLLEGTRFIFEFGNLETGGAFITIGGTIHEKGQSLPHPAGR